MRVLSYLYQDNSQSNMAACGMKYLQTNLHNPLRPADNFKNACEPLNLQAHKFSSVDEICIFQCMGKKFYVEFQRVPLKLYKKYLTHSLKDMIGVQLKKFWELFDL